MLDVICYMLYIKYYMSYITGYTLLFSKNILASS